MVRLLADADVAAVLDLQTLLPVVENALVAQARGAVERPERAHFPVGLASATEEPEGTGLSMSAYVHGASTYATKVVGVHEANPDRGLETVNASLVLTAAETGLPAAVLAGNRLTNARTACIGGLAARNLATPPVTLGLVGAGAQARWQARAIAAATDLAGVRVYSPSESRFDCAADLRAALDCPVDAVDSPREAVAGAPVVVTATTATAPVFPGDALADGAVVVAVGAYSPEMRELDAVTVSRAGRVYADVPEEAAATGDIAPAPLTADDIASLGSRFDDGGPIPDGITVVESVGTAVLDAAAGEHLLEAATDAGVGTELPLE